MKSLATLLVLAAPALTLAQQADTKSAAAVFPESTVVYAEMPHPDQLLTTLLNHPAWEFIQEIPQYKDFLRSPQNTRLQLGVKIVEGRLGMSWQETWSALTSGGIYLGIDAETNGLAILSRARDADTLRRSVDALVEMIRADAENKGKPDPLPSDSYRDIDVFKAGGGGIAILDDWLVFANNGDIGKTILDRFLDGGPSLSASEYFQNATKLGPHETVWGCVDVKTLRDAGVAKDLFAGETDNFGAELILGGILANLKETPFATGSLSLTESLTSLEFRTPHQPDWVDESREYFFGAEGKGFAPSLLDLDNDVFSLSIYRDISELWLRAGDLFDERTQDQLAEADANLSTLFAGRDFGEDVLGSLAPGMQLVVAEQDFTDQLPRPSIRLPSFALVGRLKDPETMSDEFRRTFQSMIGFLNVIGAMQGNPQLDMEMPPHDRGRIVTSRFIPESDEKDSQTARIAFNFSPTLALIDDRFILSSTTDLAQQLIDVPARAGEPAAAESINSHARLDVPFLSRVLQDNREQLIAQSMLKEGNSREEAETQIDALFSFMELVEESKFSFHADDEQLKLRLAVEYAN